MSVLGAAVASTRILCLFGGGPVSLKSSAFAAPRAVAKEAQGGGKPTPMHCKSKNRIGNRDTHVKRLDRKRWRTDQRADNKPNKGHRGAFGFQL